MNMSEIFDYFLKFSSFVNRTTNAPQAGRLAHAKRPARIQKFHTAINRLRNVKKYGILYKNSQRKKLWQIIVEIALILATTVQAKADVITLIFL